MVKITVNLHSWELLGVSTVVADCIKIPAASRRS
jgi:hypothetical protein